MYDDDTSDDIMHWMQDEQLSIAKSKTRREALTLENLNAMSYGSKVTRTVPIYYAQFACLQMVSCGTL